MFARAATTYRHIDLQSTSKAEIVARLFARCLDDLEAARSAIAVRDIPRKSAALGHADRIVVELRAALDHAAAPELAANLDALYRYVSERLTEANLTLTTQPLDAARRVMTELADAFAQVRHHR